MPFQSFSTCISTFLLVSMQNTDQPALHRVPELWFDDDNLILRAENHLFRVSKGVLAARSSVFRDMLSFPLPPPMQDDRGGGGGEGGGEDLIDGCPVVRLHDSPADVTVFLRAIFDSR